MPEPQIALKVALLGPPVNVNPYLETNAASWTALGGTVARSTAQAHEGVASLLLTPDGVSTSVEARSETQPAAAGQPFVSSAWVRCAAARSVFVGIIWRGAGGVLLTTAGSTVAVAATTWTLIDTGSLTAPAGTASAQIIVALGSTPAVSNTLHIDEAVLLPYWTDLARRLLYGDGGGPLTIDIGRQTELQDVEPTRIAATLKNGDGWLNPRNPSSPYYGTWEQGRQVRVTETVGGEEIDLATGYLEIPDVQVNSPNLDQPCSISAVDRLGRLAGAPSYSGTLAEHIRTYGGPLALHYPLTDPSLPMLSANTLSQLDMSIGQVGSFPPLPEIDPEELLQPAGMAGPPGDDQSYPLWQQSMSEDGSTFNGDPNLIDRTLDLSVTSGQTLALSFWAYLESHTLNPGVSPPNSAAIWLASASRAHQILIGGGGGNTWQVGVQAVAGGMVFADSGRLLETDAWRLVTVRVTLPSGLVELWIGGQVAASTTVPSPPATLTFNELRVGYFLWKGSLAQVQVRIGPAASTMTYAHHVAQYVHGYRGLDRQTVAERLATLAEYAGLPASELDLPAEASTPMQVAKLGGVNPGQAMQDAATAGQDTLMTTPQGRITLVPRGRRYNQPVTLAIPFGWIMRGGIRYRPDKPVTDTAASIVGGGTARRVSEPLRARHGVSGRTVTLDSAIDADAANWASWTLQAFGQPRTRCPLLRFNLLNRTAAERQALLRLKVGDRIQLTDMPANSPEDVPHLIVQGIRHIIGPHRSRRIEFNTSPLLGPAAGEPPACPVVGDLVANTAIVAY